MVDSIEAEILEETAKRMQHSKLNCTQLFIRAEKLGLHFTSLP